MKMNNYLFSIIVPIYMVQDYIHQCIDSICNQTYKNLEIVLVDDGSKDLCPKICDDYASKDDRIRVIHKNNGGLVSARQAGARVATGDYILCVDGDDWIAENYVELFAKVASDTSADMICCGFQRAYGSHFEKVQIRYACGYYDKSSIEKQIYENAIENSKATYFPTTLWSKAINRKYYIEEQLSLSPTIKIGEDGAVIKPLLFKIDSLYVLEECPYFYRQNQYSMTKVKAAFSWDSSMVAVNHINQKLKEIGVNQDIQINRLIVHGLFRIACSQFNKNKSFFSIANEIRNRLRRNDFQKAISNCQFDSAKGKFMLVVLKYRLCLLMFLYSKLK